MFKSRIILLQSFDSSLQKTDLPRLLLRRPLKSSHLLKLQRLISRQLEILPSSPKELGLLSDLFGQTLPIKRDQDKALDNSTKLLEYKKNLQQDKSGSPEFSGPQQPIPRPASPPPAATTPAESDQYWRQKEDSSAGPRPAYLKSTKTVSKKLNEKTN